MTPDEDVTAAHRASAWALTQPHAPAVGRTPSPQQRLGGPWLAAAPMLAVVGLTIATGLIVGTTARATSALGAPKSVQLAGAEQMRRQALAVQAFQAHNYPIAYGRFAELADGGDAASALMALAMVRHGPSMFGSDWSITPGQVERWSAIALRDVRIYGTTIAQHDRGE